MQNAATTILYGMIGSLIITVIYFFFFAQREAKIREQLTKIKKGRKRDRQIKAYIYAIRGNAGPVDTFIMLFVLSMVLTLGLSLSVIFYQRTISSYETALSRVDTLIEQQEALFSDGKPKDDGLLNESTETNKNLLHDLREVKKKVSSHYKISLVYSWIFNLSLVCIIIYTLLIWGPFYLMVKYIATAHQKVEQGIKALANESELKCIICTENLVTNESTLKTHFDSLYNVARRHNVSHILGIMDFWEKIESTKNALSNQVSCEEEAV